MSGSMAAASSREATSLIPIDQNGLFTTMELQEFTGEMETGLQLTGAYLGF